MDNRLRVQWGKHKTGRVLQWLTIAGTNSVVSVVQCDYSRDIQAIHITYLKQLENEINVTND